MAIVLSLFSDSEMKGMVSVPTSVSLSVSSLRSDACSPQPIGAQGCCKGCSLFGLCDSDSCAALGFPIDSPAPSTRFPNLGVYVDYLKKHGWG